MLKVVALMLIAGLTVGAASAQEAKEVEEVLRTLGLTADGSADVGESDGLDAFTPTSDDLRIGIMTRYQNIGLQGADARRSLDERISAFLADLEQVQTPEPTGDAVASEAPPEVQVDPEEVDPSVVATDWREPTDEPEPLSEIDAGPSGFRPVTATVPIADTTTIAERLRVLADEIEQLDSRMLETP